MNGFGKNVFLFFYLSQSTGELNQEIREHLDWSETENICPLNSNIYAEK